MAILTIARLEDPTVTRTVNDKSWQHWPIAKGFDPQTHRVGGAGHVWVVADEAFIAQAKTVHAASRAPISMPEEIRRVMGKDPEPQVENVKDDDPIHEDEPVSVEAEPVVEAKKRGPKPKAK